MQSYLEDSARTVAGEVHTKLVHKAALLDVLTMLKTIAGPIDQIKKGLFYGKDTEDLQYSRAVMGGDGDMDPDLDYQFIHGVLGILTEAHELGELLAQYLTDPEWIETEEFKEKVVNESGDSLWYFALLFRNLKTTFEKVGELNLAKLRKRFPDKFDTNLAIHRDESQENTVFQ